MRKIEKQLMKNYKDNDMILNTSEKEVHVANIEDILGSVRGSTSA